MPVHTRKSAQENARLPHAVFTRPDSVNEGGIFDANYGHRLNFLRSWAEDVEQDLRMAQDTREKQARQAVTGHDHADVRRAERIHAVEACERAAVRHTAGLLAQMARFTDESVFVEEITGVLTERDLDTLIASLQAVRSEQ